MYYPLQIPYILNRDFVEAVRYQEEVEPQLMDFIICFWEMQPKDNDPREIENVIVADGCIDLVTDFDGQSIGFVGMSKTNFHFRQNSSCRYFGVRMKPGAFYALTGISADKAMDRFIPIQAIHGDFNIERFFKLSFDKAKEVIKNFFVNLIDGQKANEFVLFFDDLIDNIPETAVQIYKRLNLSPKQCQRLFYKHFGLSPQTVLCILRFQKCLDVLASGEARPGDVFSIVNYYDQAHFIKDFKRHIGITPVEFVNRCR